MGNPEAREREAVPASLPSPPVPLLRGCFSLRFLFVGVAAGYRGCGSPGNGGGGKKGGGGGNGSVRQPAARTNRPSQYFILFIIRPCWLAARSPDPPVNPRESAAGAANPAVRPIN